jgi:tetratricopeptide (TPR) repeat protein
MTPIWSVTSFSVVSRRTNLDGTVDAKPARGPLAAALPILITVWLLIPLGVAAYHYGPGQKDLIVDDAGRLLKLGEALVAAGRPAEAIEAYEQALPLIPEEKIHQQRQVRLEIAKLQMISQGLPDAYMGLMALVEEMRADPNADPKLTSEAEAAYANAQYYLTWLLRLEGAPREVWEPEIEAARQTFRELAETTAEATAVTADEQEQNETKAKKYREDLEATIRLARMNLDELQGLPLPCQCRGCCTGNCKGKGKCKCKKKGKGKGKKKKKDARGASSGPPPDGSGS